MWKKLIIRFAVILWFTVVFVAYYATFFSKFSFYLSIFPERIRNFVVVLADFVRNL